VAPFGLDARWSFRSGFDSPSDEGRRKACLIVCFVFVG
jgi:hypothetical protein